MGFVINTRVVTAIKQCAGAAKNNWEELDTASLG